MRHHKYNPSSLFRIQLCPSSADMCEGLEDQPSDDASKGTKLHDMAASLIRGEREKVNLAELNADERGALEAVCSFVDELRRTTPSDNRLELVEEEVAILGNDMELLTFGTPDYAMLTEKNNASGTYKKAVIADWKFGRNEVPEPAENLQLAAYAVGLWQKYGIASAECHIIQPFMKSPQFHEFKDFFTMHEKIEGIVAEAKKDGIRLNAGVEQCQYCRAKITCPAYSRKFAMPAVAGLPENDLALLPRMPQLLQAAKMAEKMARAIKDKAKSLIQSGRAIPGWTLTEGRKTREIKDINKCYKIAASKIGMSNAEFVSVCKVCISDLEKLACDKLIEAAKARNEKLTAKAAREELARLMAGCVELKQSSPILAEV